jgi:hypothetical protein
MHPGMGASREQVLRGKKYRAASKRLLQRLMYKYYRPRLSRTFFGTGLKQTSEWLPGATAGQQNRNAPKQNL